MMLMQEILEHFCQFGLCIGKTEFTFPSFFFFLHYVALFQAINHYTVPARAHHVTMTLHADFNVARSLNVLQCSASFLAWQTTEMLTMQLTNLG